MDEKDFSRFESLFNLAMNNPDTNEVRNASVLLVKMISKHNLLQTIRGTISNSNYYQPQPTPQNTNTSYSKRKYNPTKTPSSDPKYIYLNFIHLSNKYKNDTIKSKASRTVDYIADFLDEKYIANGHKDLIIGVPTIIDLALKDNLISPGELFLYTKHLRHFLQQEVTLGLLIGVRGRSGGYKLK